MSELKQLIEEIVGERKENLVAEFMNTNGGTNERNKLNTKKRTNKECRYFCREN